MDSDRRKGMRVWGLGESRSRRAEASTRSGILGWGGAKRVISGWDINSDGQRDDRGNEEGREGDKEQARSTGRRIRD